MFDWKVKDIKATNAIFLAEIGDDEGRPFKSRFLQAGLVKYDFGVCLLKKETIDKFVNTFINQPVIIGHKDDIKKDDVVGYVHNIWFSPEDGWFWCDGKLTDKEAIKKVEKGFNVSCQYRITEYSNNTDKKLHNGNPYDKEILSGIFEHLAIVENPRYEDAFIAVNAYIAENEDRWITIKPNGEENKGRHLLLKDGETPGEAIQRVYGNKDQQTLFDTSDYKKTKEDYKKEKEKKEKEFEEGIKKRQEEPQKKEATALKEKTNLEEKENTYKDVLKKYNEASKKRWDRNITPEEYHKAWDDSEKYKKELTKARREYAESIMSNFEETDNNAYEEKQAERKARYSQLSQKAAEESSRAHQQFRDKMSFIPAGQPIHGAKDARYREKTWDTLGRAVKLNDKAEYYSEKADSVGKAGISSDDANAIAKLAKKYQSGVDSAEKRRIIDRVIDIYKRKNIESSSKSEDYSQYGFNVERNTDINRLQLKFNGKPDENTRSILKSYGFRWSPREGAWQRQLTGNAEYSLKQITEKLKAKNNIKNEARCLFQTERASSPDELENSKHQDVLLNNSSVAEKNINFNPKATNSFVEQFKDVLYETIAEGIVKRLGELKAVNFDESKINRDEKGRFTEKNNINPNYEKELTQVIEKAKNNPTETHKLIIGKVSKKLEEKARINGFDIAGFNHDIDVSGTRHAFKEHGTEKTEKPRGQVPIDDNDFKNIPDVIYNYDEITFTGKNKTGLETITYKKKMKDNTIYYVEEIRTGRKTLTINTMYKHKNTGSPKTSAKNSNLLNNTSIYIITHI